jgi:hypothetical protein
VFDGAGSLHSKLVESCQTTTSSVEHRARRLITCLQAIVESAVDCINPSGAPIFSSKKTIIKIMSIWPAHDRFR